MNSGPIPLEEHPEQEADVRDVDLHPTTLCEEATLGPGTRVGPFTSLRPGVVVGRDCVLGAGVTVEGGVLLGDRVTVSDGAALCCGASVENDVAIGPGVVFADRRVPRRSFEGQPEKLLPIVVRQRAVVGAGAVVLAGTVIGEGAFVGPGTLVERNVPDGAIIIAPSPRRVGWLCRCGRHLPDTLMCPACRRSYRLTRSGLRELPR